MRHVGAFEAKNTLGDLLDQVEQGEEIVITRHGRKIARIVRETEEGPDAAEQQRLRQQALADLRAFQAQVQPPVEGYSDWKSLRDAGRKV